MKKVLIISYFFPPCNLTASQRIQGWANYLNENGYFPVIVTRNWDIHIEHPEDVLKGTGNTTKHEVNENYEVYYLPYYSSRRDRIYSKYKDSPLQKLSRVFTFFNLLSENYFVNSIPHKNLYDFSRRYLRDHEDIDKMIISGNPFNQFYFGFLLQKEFGIQWIADYRDDWNTSEVEAKKTGLNSVIGKLQSRSEKKWVGSAAMITSVSSHYVDKISEYVNKPGHVILNGYELENKENHHLNPDTFVLTYNGSLYPTQPIEPLLKAIGELISDGYTELQIQFPGLAFNPQQALRVEKLTVEYAGHVKITNRIPKQDVINLQNRSDLLIMIAHTGIKGVPSSKLYEYIGLRKQVLLFPNDHNIIEETLKDTELGLICENESDIKDRLKTLLEAKRAGTIITLRGNQEKIEFYSRRHQAKELALLLDNMN